MRPRRLSLNGFSVMTLKSVTGSMTLPTLMAIPQTPAELGATARRRRVGNAIAVDLDVSTRRQAIRAEWRPLRLDGRA